MTWRQRFAWLQMTGQTRGLLKHAGCSHSEVWCVVACDGVWAEQELQGCWVQTQ